MIFGIGTDIVAVARTETACKRHGSAFAAKILSEQELVEYATQSHPARFLSKRFAAKEAFAKATGYGLRYPVSLKRITVTHDDLGKPAFLFDDELEKRAAGLAGATH